MAFINLNTSEFTGDMFIDDISDIANDKETVSDNLILSLLVWSSTNFTVIFLYWTYLLYTSFNQNTSSSPLFPNILLLGLFLGSSSSLAHITLDPTSTSSCITSLLVPISYSMIYSTLLVRMVYIYSLHKDMYRLPTFYQTLLLFFCVMVQVSVSIQSFLLTQLTVCPSHTSIYSSPFTDMISLSYSLFLLMSITCFSTMQRRRREQRQEAWSIWIFSILSVTLWVAWMAIALIFDEHYRVIKGLGHEAGSSLAVLLLLLPKSRRHVFTGKVNPYSQARIPVFGAIRSPPLMGALTWGSTVQPELFHQVATVPPLPPPPLLHP